MYRIEPGDIDNSPLVDKIISNDCVQLKSNLRSGIHFEIVPELLWLFLRKYYRCNGPIIWRKVVFKKKLNRPELDLYPVSVVCSIVLLIVLVFLPPKVMVKIYRNELPSPQQIQTNNSPAGSPAYPWLNYVSAGLFGTTLRKRNSISKRIF